MERTLREFWGWLGFKDMPAQPLQGVSVVKLDAGVGEDGLKRQVHVRVHANSELEIRNILLRPESSGQSELPLRMDAEIRAKVLFNGVSKPPSIVVAGVMVRDDNDIWKGTVFDTEELPVDSGLQRDQLRPDQLQAICGVFCRAVQDQTPIGSAENPWTLELNKKKGAEASVPLKERKIADEQRPPRYSFARG